MKDYKNVKDMETKENFQYSPWLILFGTNFAQGSFLGPDLPLIVYFVNIRRKIPVLGMFSI